MIVNSLDTLQQAFAFISGNEMLAYDTETTGLNVRKDKVIGFGISNGLSGFYVPIYTWTKQGLVRNGLSDEHITQILNLLKTKQLLAFNAAFDMPITKNSLGVDLLPALHTDVLLLKHTIDEWYPFGLKEIAKMLFGTDATTERDAMKASIKANGGSSTEYYKADMKLMAEYCIKDCLLTYRIYNHYKPHLIKQGLYEFFYNNEVMPFYKSVVIQMEQRGIRMDVAKIATALKEITADISAIESNIQSQIAPLLGTFTKWFLDKNYALKTATGKAPAWSKRYSTQYDAWRAENEGYMFNLSSKVHLKKLFFDTLKETPLSFTPTGLGQVNEDLIESLQSKYEWCKDLVVYNKLNKIKSTYYERILEGCEGEIYYPRFLLHGTVSGRLSSDLQQLPRPIESGDSRVVRYTNLIRTFLIARDGHVFIDSDYTSLEPHLFASISEDPALISIFNDGVDFYSFISIKTERLEGYSANPKDINYLGKVNKGLRQKAKAYSLGIPYGLGSYKLQFELGVPQEEAEQLIKNYFSAFPKLKEWIDRSHNSARLYGYIKTQSGRIRHMPRLKQLHEKYGVAITDSLMLYKTYNNSPVVYEKAKLDRKEYKNLLNNSINVQVQGLASSVLNQSGINMVKAFKEAGLSAIPILACHDEWLIECLESEKEQVKQIMKQCMENVFKLNVQLKAEPQEGKNYADAK